MIDSSVATTTTISETSSEVRMYVAKCPTSQAVTKLAGPPGAPSSWPNAATTMVRMG